MTLSLSSNIFTVIQGMSIDYAAPLLLLILAGIPILGIIAWGLVDVCIEMFKKRPWDGIRYGKTGTYDAIARVMMGEYRGGRMHTVPRESDTESYSEAEGFSNPPESG